MVNQVFSLEIKSLWPTATAKTVESLFLIVKVCVHGVKLHNLTNYKPLGQTPLEFLMHSGSSKTTLEAQMKLVKNIEVELGSVRFNSNKPYRNPLQPFYSGRRRRGYLYR